MSEPLNQCEGCQAGWPTVERYHRVAGAGGYAGEIAACTRDRYAIDWRARAMAAEAALVEGLAELQLLDELEATIRAEERAKMLATPCETCAVLAVDEQAIRADERATWEALADTLANRCHGEPGCVGRHHAQYCQGYRDAAEHIASGAHTAALRRREGGVMRTVTKAEVLEAADWCAQLNAWLMSNEYDIGSLDEPPRPVHELACDAYFGCSWMRASSILYAAALEGGPMPAGWGLVDGDICGPVMARIAAARRAA